MMCNDESLVGAQALAALRRDGIVRARDSALDGFRQQLDKGPYASSTRATYFRLARGFFDWLDSGEYPDAFKDAPGRDHSVAAYCAELAIDRGCSNSTLNSVLRVLSLLYEWLTLGTPASERSEPEDAPLPTLTARERSAVRRIAADRSFRDQALVELMLDFGPTIDQVLALRRRDLKLITHNSGRVRCTNADGSERWVDLKPATVVALRRWLAERRKMVDSQKKQTLFLTRHSVDAISTRGLYFIIHEIGLKAGVDLSPSTLRQTGRTTSTEIVVASSTPIATSEPSTGRRPRAVHRRRRGPAPEQLPLDFGALV